MKEEYKKINYRGLDIEVSNFGKIICNGKERNIYYNNDGYSVCSLKIPNVGWRSAFVHKLVAIAFIPNPNNLPEVNHKDYNRKNPKSDNLEWISHKDNIIYSKCNMPDYHGSKNPNYNNKKLSKKYKNDKELSKLKQGRPGTQNGRSTPIDLYYDGKFVKSFDYIKQCCRYFIDNNICNIKEESIRGQINKCIRKNILFKKHYSFVKR